MTANDDYRLRIIWAAGQYQRGRRGSLRNGEKSEPNTRGRGESAIPTQQSQHPAEIESLGVNHD